MGDRLRFGIFMAPFHAPGTNPTLALQRDLELIQHLDRLGYDEAWIGEHHSAGSEIIASPEIFIADGGRAHPPHQARHRRRQPLLPQPPVGGGADRPARPPDARPGDAGRGPRGAADGRGDDRRAAAADARAAGAEPRRDHAAADERGAGHLQERPLGPARRAAAPAALLRSAVRRRGRRRRLALGAAARRPARRRPAVDRGHECRRVRRAGAALGRDGGAWRRGTARPSTARSGGWSASSTAPRPRSRPTATSSTASSSGSATSRRSRPFRRCPCRGDTRPGDDRLRQRVRASAPSARPRWRRRRSSGWSASRTAASAPT